VHVGLGTRALVTGASRGIGRALAELLAARGATVGLAARSTRELGALAAALGPAGTEHPVLECDVADRASVQAAVDAFTSATGGLDLVVANAGITHFQPVAAQDVQRIEEMTRVNWLGTVYTVQAALPTLLQRGAGHIVVVSAGAALRSFPGAAAYGATKAAQRGFAEALRHELAGTGVSLTTVYPGEIATSLHDHEKATMPPWYEAGGRRAPAEALAVRILKAVEADRRDLHYPPHVRLLGALHAVSPRACDAVLRRLRGISAAPRRD
jgi:short-subunit dehydrogenase